MSSSLPPVDIEKALAQLRDEDPVKRKQAVDLIVAYFLAAFRPHVNRCKRRMPTVDMWESTDDLLQIAAMKMMNRCRNNPEGMPTERKGFDSLASLMIKDVLIDKLRSFLAKLGPLKSRDGAFPEDANNGEIRESAPPDPRAARLALPEDAVNDETSATGRYTRKQFLEAFQSRLDAMPATIRDVARLRLNGAGLSNVEIAEILGISAKAVGNRWQRFIKLFTDWMTRPDAEDYMSLVG